MKPTTEQEAPNKTIALLRKLAAEKRETKRQMREAFETDPDVQQALAQLKHRNQTHARESL